MGQKWPQLKPCLGHRLYDCKVMHARLSPRTHRFVHDVFALAVDLDTLPDLGKGLCLIGPDGWRPYQIRERDFLPRSEIFHPQAQHIADFGQPGDGLKARVLAFCRARGATIPDHARVTLVAMPRAFGRSYNPASFHLVEVEGALVAAIAEVHNTFGERKAWFLGPDCRQPDGSLHLRTPKQFYVSPFSGLETEFEFTVRMPSERLLISVDHFEGGAKTLVSAWTGQQVPLTDTRLAWLTLCMPFLILKVISLIHLHALWLWLAKRLPFRRKKDNPKSQHDLRDPHPSTPHA